jgi:AraC family transcriptional regulator, regulatory protein of adaptative response / methylated-DNA-[protein]-cysteine methyltransferase
MSTNDYSRVAEAIEFLVRNAGERPQLAEVARHVGLSEFHFQRTFRRWCGITPSQFSRFVSLGIAKEALRESTTTFDATLSAGLSSPSRLHDLFVTFEAVTPGEFRRLGRDVEVRWGHHDTPLGVCAVGVTDRGICALGFVDDAADAEAHVASRLPAALLTHSHHETAQVIAALFDSGRPQLPVHAAGTNFQVKVWQALLEIAPGSSATYEELAQAVGRPDAVRAVANAVGANPVAVLIPCHRVIRKSGALGGYRWGIERKIVLRACEGS